MDLLSWKESAAYPPVKAITPPSLLHALARRRTGLDDKLSYLVFLFGCKLEDVL
jgi:hypothetical protein